MYSLLKSDGRRGGYGRMGSPLMPASSFDLRNQACEFTIFFLEKYILVELLDNSFFTLSVTPNNMR